MLLAGHHTATTASLHPLSSRRRAVPRPRLAYIPKPRQRRPLLRIQAAEDSGGALPAPAPESAANPLKIAIVGFGNFGQFLARAFARQGHTLLAHSRTDHTRTAESLGAAFFRDPHDLCEQHPDVVLLATSILSAAPVLRSLPLSRLRRSTLFVDVLSVKEFPRDLLLSHLPPDFDILCTHPMFGPESARQGWAGLPFVFDKVRVSPAPPRARRCHDFLAIFAREGCRMVEMSCADHDRISADIQFLTHTVGRMLARLQLKSTPINTKGYEKLLNVVENTCSDSFDLYNGLFMYNKNATELLDRLESAFHSLKKELYGNLHDKLRKQLFVEPPATPPLQERVEDQLKNHHNGVPLLDDAVDASIISTGHENGPVNVEQGTSI